MMYSHKIKVTIPTDHQVTLRLPDEFPPGPAEVIVLSKLSEKKQLLKLTGILSSKVNLSTDTDPIAESIQELRQERKLHFEDLGIALKEQDG